MFSIYPYLPVFLLRWRRAQLLRRIARLESEVRGLKGMLSGVEGNGYTYVYREHLCRQLEDVDTRRIETALELKIIEEILPVN